MTRYFGLTPELSSMPETSAAALNDNGGRRWGVERRRFDYTACIPERRSGRDRRSGQDRRNCPRLTQHAGFFRP
jgi:hypothetical protein